MSNVTRAIRYLYQTDFPAFIGLTARLIAPNRQFQHHWMIELLGEALSRCERRECTRLIINLPPRSLKSVAASVALPAWILARNPYANVLCVGGHRDLVKTHHLQTEKLMSDKKYRSIFPHVKVTASGTTLRLPHGGSRTGLTPSQGITGRGADFVIIDDPLPASKANDDAARILVNNWYDENIYQRLDSKSFGVIIVVMQRLHYDDLTAHLLAHKNWELITLPAIAVEDETFLTVLGEKAVRLKGEALQPEIETREQLRTAMMQMGAKPFMAQYQQKPYLRGQGDGRRGYYSELRKGVRWKYVPLDELQSGFTSVKEERILLHTVFGEGEHPWPDDMRLGLEEDEVEDAFRPLREEYARMHGGYVHASESSGDVDQAATTTIEDEEEYEDMDFKPKYR